MGPRLPPCPNPGDPFAQQRQNVTNEQHSAIPTLSVAAPIPQSPSKVAALVAAAQSFQLSTPAILQTQLIPQPPPTPTPTSLTHQPRMALETVTTQNGFNSHITLPLDSATLLNQTPNGPVLTEHYHFLTTPNPWPVATSLTLPHRDGGTHPPTISSHSHNQDHLPQVSQNPTLKPPHTSPKPMPASPNQTLKHLVPLSPMTRSRQPDSPKLVHNTPAVFSSPTTDSNTNAPSTSITSLENIRHSLSQPTSIISQPPTPNVPFPNSCEPDNQQITAASLTLDEQLGAAHFKSAQDPYKKPTRRGKVFAE